MESLSDVPNTQETIMLRIANKVHKNVHIARKTVMKTKRTQMVNGPAPQGQPTPMRKMKPDELDAHQQRMQYAGDAMEITISPITVQTRIKNATFARKVDI